MKGTKLVALYFYILILIIMGIFPGQGSANSNQILSNGQSVYVPVYSHIYHGDHGDLERQFYLTATLSIRNTKRTRHFFCVQRSSFSRISQTVLTLAYPQEII